MANYRARPASLYEGQEVLDQMGRTIHGTNMTNTNYATYSSQHLNHLTQPQNQPNQNQQLQHQQQQLINNAFSSSNVNLQNLVQQNLQATRQPNGGSPNTTSSPYVQQPYSTTDLHRFSQNADKYTSEVSSVNYCCTYNTLNFEMNCLLTVNFYKLDTCCREIINVFGSSDRMKPKLNAYIETQINAQKYI